MFNDTRLCDYLELLTYFGAPANETQDNLYHTMVFIQSITK